LDERLAELRRRLGEVSDLRSASALLEWDQMVMMPPAGAAVRADRLATLERVAHERFVDDRIGELVEDLRELEASLAHDSGNVMSVQIWEAAQASLPGIEERFEQGDFSELGEWLRENLYSLGRKLTPKETLERVAGGPLDAEPYLRYLRSKYGAGVTA